MLQLEVMVPLLANGMSLYHGLLFSQCRLKVASPNDNFTLFRANCKEDHKVVHIFTKQLLSDIVRIESKTYLLNNREVTFRFELVPSDMKFLAFLNGELSNAATYFSSFATFKSGFLFTW